MTEQQTSAPARAKSGHPAGGVEHVTEPHHDRFVVVGNHLAQHPELSLTAIGLAVHIQSLPARTPIGIKTLTAKFPEGEIRIAAALRELEAHGYLARTKERLQSGHVVTRTISYNKPRLAMARALAEPAPRPTPAPSPQTPAAAPRTAMDLLAGLRAYDSRLLLAERDVHRLAPAVSAWLERGVPPTAVQRTLTNGLPKDPILHPAAFLAHRLEALLPPPLPDPVPRLSPIRPDPLQTCDDCDRAFRAPVPGRCRDCRTSRIAA
ncbi:helix-turn-helix domain-containing protein [Streptomyces sp. AS02]|uniref:helix-turn-helix domain-containing protein n=1 Tax=Streptomyces sp. AS02 TaxID=2938946 RepID=UPI0020215511|nr:helix-turn-helix domain-containing protein [Streptomyces sp. AS02]MCL8013959.1 helix-turn-helix domain-containing protein [Streptomyces sp. AS02]